jgi:hypothetical protein
MATIEKWFIQLLEKPKPAYDMRCVTRTCEFSDEVSSGAAREPPFDMWSVTARDG